MTNASRNSLEHLDALAEANVQFHWGAVVEEVEIAASRLRAMDLNPMLASGLETRTAGAGSHVSGAVEQDGAADGAA